MIKISVMYSAHIRHIFIIFFTFMVISLLTTTTASANDDKKLHSGVDENDKINTFNDKELKWYNRFQEGILLLDGWQAITEEILRIYPEDKRKDGEIVTERLGRSGPSH